MTRHLRQLVALAGVALFITVATTYVAAQSAPAAPPKLISPVRGEAEIGFTQPTPRNDGKMIITTFKVMNLASAPIAGLKIDEFWYDKNRQLVGGAPSFRYRKPLAPMEVISIELKTPVNPAMSTPQWKFEHANGAIKTTKMTDAEMKKKGKPAS